MLTMRSVTLGTNPDTAWTITVDDKVMPISKRQIDHGVRMIRAWVHAFHREETWIQRQHRVPSLIVRLDCVPDQEGSQLHIFEIEERPAGLGVASEIDATFSSRLCTMKSQWPPFVVVRSRRRNGAGDDYLWAPITDDLSDPALKDSLVLVRADPDESQFYPLEERAISSLREKGNKDYGVAMGFWTCVSRPDELPWQEGFCLKPMRGSKAHGIEIWDAGKKQRGYSTRTRIERTLHAYGEMYCQPLVMPFETRYPDRRFGMARVFYGYDVNSREWRYLGGYWIARDALKIHCTPDALVGPLTIADDGA